MNTQNLLNQFTKPLLTWFLEHGRKDLPWQSPRTPYRVWVSEIMLQQTQVQTVIGYFDRFMARFPTIWDLAQAKEDDVLALWSGLGYYSRARNLHKTAQIIAKTFEGRFPKDLELLKSLPGIGPSTAAAVLAQAFEQPYPILDANVKRVLTRFFRVKGWPEQSSVKKQLWELADLCMPKKDCADYTQAIMDLGALCCTARNPNCINCPVQAHCLAYKHQEVLQYPNKKLKKPIPQRQQQFLVLINHQGLIYLEKRPPTGIWGGLWCLPSIEVSLCPIEYIEHNYALRGSELKPLMQIKHRFSHFQLDIKVVSIKVSSSGDRIAECLGEWFGAEEFAGLGLARPTQTILNALEDRCWVACNPTYV